MILLAAALVSTCIAIEGERIRAGDLARSVPALAALAPDEPLGYAPAPGAKRMLGIRELERMASQHGITLAPVTGICVERAVEQLTEERILAALRAAVGSEQARVELLAFSRYPVPRGELEFARSGFLPSPAGAKAPVVWRGRLRYAGNRSLPVWARVRVSMAGQRLVAAEILPAGQAIQPSQVRVEAAELSPFAEAGMESFAQIAGRVPRRSIRAGEAVAAKALVVPPAVARGDTVSVEVSSGAAQLKLKARAESAGQPGDVILLRNPENGQRFQARVSHPGKVTIDAKQNTAVGAAVPAGNRRPSR